MGAEFTNAGFWSIIPPLVAITLALITKEVIFSLLVGIMSGALIYSGFFGLGAVGIFTVTVETMAEQFDATMVIFLALLGALVALITKAGGSNSYGAWAQRKIKSKKSAGFLTVLLGMILFIDDYFNCLTLGTIMRPITDRYKMSREKLSYLIDATAAPICIIAPISSWAAAVISYYPTRTGVSGMQAFIGSIPMNLYALLTLFMIMWLSLRRKGDFGPMAAAERRAEETGKLGNEETSSNSGDDELEKLDISPKGTIIDLVIPVAFLVLFSVLAMLFSGGYWNGEGLTLFDAFGETDAGFSLALGGLGALIVTFFMFVPRKLIGFRDYFSVMNKGVKSMVPAIIILTLAWTIGGICRYKLNTGDYVATLVEASSMPVAIIPAIMFIIAALLSFAIGTSWGTFGILIPIGITICDSVAPHLSIVTLSAILAGSVFGDHSSPISDTTILASIGGRCNLIDHITTQLPYAIVVAVISFIGYIVYGIISPMGYAASVAITLPSSLALLIIALLIIPKVWKVKNNA
ncbi:MAG: Na+/H+ antiporter NhaC family protein [Treponema sp.]|nr:Na+/H+ antiporter NhaC family protein [Treponema sp.]